MKKIIILISLFCSMALSSINAQSTSRFFNRTQGFSPSKHQTSSRRKITFKPSKTVRKPRRTTMARRSHIKPGKSYKPGHSYAKPRRTFYGKPGITRIRPKTLKPHPVALSPATRQALLDRYKKPSFRRMRGDIKGTLYDSLRKQRKSPKPGAILGTKPRLKEPGLKPDKPLIPGKKPGEAKPEKPLPDEEVKPEPEQDALGEAELAQADEPVIAAEEVAKGEEDAANASNDTINYYYYGCPSCYSTCTTCDYYLSTFPWLNVSLMFGSRGEPVVYIDEEENPLYFIKVVRDKQKNNITEQILTPNGEEERLYIYNHPTLGERYNPKLGNFIIERQIFDETGKLISQDQFEEGFEREKVGPAWVEFHKAHKDGNTIKIREKRVEWF